MGKIDFVKEHAVIFRTWKNSNGIVALLPELPSEGLQGSGEDSLDICSAATFFYDDESSPSYSPNCFYLSGSLTGEHSRPATESEYLPLKNWLESKGLRVKVVTEATDEMTERRHRISDFEKAHKGCGYNVSLIHLWCGRNGTTPTGKRRKKPFATLYKPSFWNITGRYRNC